MDYQTRVNQTYAGLNQYYDPTRRTYEGQIKNVAQEFDPERQMMEQARRNAFRDIETTANKRGVFYSGAPIQGQQDYTDTKYLPTMYDINKRQLTRKQSLELALAELSQRQSKDATSIVDKQIKAEEDARKRAEDLAYREAQLQLSRARLARSGSSRQAKSEYGISYKKDNAGYMFTGPGKTPISLGEYVAGTGGGADAVLNLLKNSASAYDRQIYKAATWNIPTPLNAAGRANYVLKKIAQLDKQNFYGLQ